jgi:S1-C subfamily serine protease
VTAPQAETKVETKAKTKVETKAKTKVEAKAKATAEANLDAKPAIRVTAIRKESQPEPKLPSFRLREVRAEVSQYVRGDSSYRVRLSRAGHIRLAGVNGKSLLHRIGLRDGDEIKTVAGVRINSRSTAVDAYLALRPGTTMEIVLIRKGKQQSVRLQII